MALLEVDNLEVTFPTRRGKLHALRGVSLSLDAGERLGIVGESGAGKSMAAFAILNLISEPGRISDGHIRFEGRDLATTSEDEIRAIRGDRISMIFQDPMMTLNPVMTVGTQMVETLQAHRTISETDARDLSIAKLAEVQIPSPEARFDAYPHELSGGLRQRVVIAIALLSDPAIIIADEPTTALDVTIQAEILALLLALCRDHDTALILITHDLAVVSQVTEQVMVMYAGRIVEAGPTRRIIDAPQHPYTRGLIAALPEQNKPGQPLNQIPGSMPSLDNVPPGCAFSPRCTFADDLCRSDIPELNDPDHPGVACHHVERVAETSS
ncbi:MAG: ABC transporter ATP-binding protein [Hyphomicrobiaceae bacterium]